MPSHIPANHNHKPKAPNRKLIKKQQKIGRINSTNTPSDCDFNQENTMSETIIAHGQCQSIQNLQRVTRLVKFANFRFKFSIDTYLACLNILNSLKIDIHQTKIRLTAAAVILVAGKVHEFRTPKFVDLLAWGDYEFRSCDLVKAEAQLLALLDFKVPVALKCPNMKAIEQQIKKLEAKIHSPTFLFQ